MYKAVSGLWTISGNARATKNTPALTIVAAWIKAETVVGPSIASGSHTCSGNCADFPTEPPNKQRVAHLISSRLFISNSGSANNSEYLRVPNVLYSITKPRSKNTSPTLVTKKAFFAADAAEGFSYQ